MSSKKKHNPAPVPPGNRQHAQGQGDTEQEPNQIQQEIGYQEEDPKRRLGDFTGTAEHSIQEPDGKNGANH